MPANPSADGLRRAMRVRIITAGATFSPREKLRLLALNAIPLAHLLSLALVVACIPGNLVSRFLVGVVWLLLPPPLIARLVLKSGLPQGEIAVPSDVFFRWWRF